MSEDVLHDFIAEMFKAWEDSVYFSSALDERVKTLNEFKKAYVELSSAG